MSYYIDLDISIETINGEPQLIADNDVIVQSMVYLLLTEPGEIEFDPDCGSEITTLLFETPTNLKIRDLEFSTKSFLERYEPRANIKEVKCEFEKDDRVLLVKIYFSTRELPNLVHELIVNLRRRLI